MSENRDSTSRPPARPSLQAERDQFLGTFFQKGAKITREVLDENQRLRERVEQLELELEAMRLQMQSHDAIRELLAKVKQLEEDKQKVLAKLERAKQESSRVEGARQEIEEELTNLASLYVAERQLHAELVPEQVIERIRDILEQLLGAEHYAVYMVSEGSGQLVCVASRGGEDRLSGDREALAREVILTGTSVISESIESDRNETPDKPVACVPLRLGNRTLGVVIIFSVLEQKREFIPLDYELFELLRSQAALALIAAKLFTEAGGRVPSFPPAPLSK